MRKSSSVAIFPEICQSHTARKRTLSISEQDKEYWPSVALYLPMALKFFTANGSEICHRKRFVDHHSFSKNELENIFNIACARGATFAIPTKKDAIQIIQEFEPLISTHFPKIDTGIVSDEKIFEGQFPSLAQLLKSKENGKVNACFFFQLFPIVEHFSVHVTHRLRYFAGRNNRDFSHCLDIFFGSFAFVRYFFSCYWTIFQ
jgi:hypothetical protein